MTSGVSTGYCPMSDAGHLALANMTVLPVALPMAAAVVLVLTAALTWWTSIGW